jgi:solute carrier family 13 (sodium-dependent dicarboxylate transporter), member 2/3/5
MVPSGRSPEPEEGRSGGVAKVGRWLGVGLFLLVLALPAPEGLDPAGWRVAALGVLMAVWWMSEAVPLAVTALLPLVLLPTLGILPVERAAAPFANPVIFLFMGGFMLGQAMQRWDLHRRIAFAILARTGTSPRSLVAGFMAATAFLSMWVSNTAVAVMMLPVGVSVIQAVGRGPGEGSVPPGDPDFARALLLGIAYAASVGGMATLIGTPPNALLAGFLSEQYGIVLGFGEWMLLGLPLAILTLPLVWLVLTRVSFRPDPVGRSLPPGALQAMRAGLGAIRAAERRVGWVFGATAAFWIGRPLLERVLPGLSDAGIAMGATLALFLLPSGRTRGEALLDWDWARRIPWDILLLFGGGLSLAGAISETGLASWIGGGVGGLGHLPVPVLLLAVVALLVFLTELTSNTASTAAFLPVLAAVALALGHPALLLLVPATLAASCAFMLPVATPPNAIVFGSRWIEIRHMVRAGLVLNILFILLLPFLALLLLRIFFGVEPAVASPWG